MDAQAENPKAVVGDNRAPNYAQQVTEAMQREYAALAESVATLLERARALPKEVNDDATMGTFAKLIKDLRDAAKRIEAFHAAEKEPHLRAGQAVDQFFFPLWEKCARRAKNQKPGAADVLNARVDDYQLWKLRAEQERLRLEAEEKARAAREAEERARREAAEAEEARLAADRARKPETIASKEEVAAAAEAAASASAANAQVAAEQAQAAHVDTLRKPADLVRTRVDGGPIATLVNEPYAVVVDEAKLDRDALWPFISLDAKEKALRAWAKTTGHNKPMAGAEVGRKPKSQIR
jgi:hypothetical protein